MKKWLYLVLPLLACSCGYRYAPQGEVAHKTYSVTVPYIPGDTDAILNNELVYQLSSSGHFHCVQSGGDYVLQAAVVSDTQTRVGFRYDRDNVTGKLEKNLLGVEDRRTVTVEVSLIEKGSNKVIAGPFEVSSDVDYDYIDPGSPKDLLFHPSSGPLLPVIQLSVGQLDSYEGAFDDTSHLVFRRVAEKIAQGLVNHLQQ